jgi:hypothetical protein
MNEELEQIWSNLDQRKDRNFDRRQIINLFHHHLIQLRNINTSACIHKLVLFAVEGNAHRFNRQKQNIPFASIYPVSSRLVRSFPSQSLKPFQKTRKPIVPVNFHRYMSADYLNSLRETMGPGPIDLVLEIDPHPGCGKSESRGAGHPFTFHTRPSNGSLSTTWSASIRSIKILSSQSFPADASRRPVCESQENRRLPDS